MMTAHTDMDLISNHIENTIGKIHTVLHEIISDEVHLDVCYVKSDPSREFEALITMGMSAIPINTPAESNEPKYIELIILLPKDWPLEHLNMFSEDYYWPIRLLKDLARFAHHNQTYLGYAHTIANAENENELSPYAKNNNFCASILLPSMTLGEESFILRRDDDQDIYFFCVVPIFQDELFFKFEHGADQLMNLFDEHQVSDIVDIYRHSVTPQPKEKFGLSFEAIYGSYSFNYFDHIIDIFVVAISGRVVVQVDNQVILDSRKFTTTHKCYFEQGDKRIDIVIKQKNIISTKLFITVSSSHHEPQEFLYDMSEDPALEHLCGKNKFIISIIIGALDTLATLYVYRHYGVAPAVIFGVVFTLFWWIAEYVFLRKNR
jgi:Suppressor of fused protein (SUFU)